MTDILLHDNFEFYFLTISAVVLFLVIVGFIISCIPTTCTKCKSEKTNRSDGLCESCFVENANEDPDEKTIHCPHDNHIMTKICSEHAEDIIIDKCPHCGGVWLDPEELTKITEKLRSKSSSGNFAVGMALGATIS